MLAPFGLNFVISSKKCTPWENVSLRFDNDLKGLNANCLGGCRLMERDVVDLNLVKVAKTKFDGTSDVGVGLLMYNCKSMPTKWLGFHFSVS